MRVGIIFLILFGQHRLLFLVFCNICECFTLKKIKKKVIKSLSISFPPSLALFPPYPTSLSWLFLYEKAYQVRDTAIESSVMTKVKGFGEYNNQIMDVADYVTPTQVNLKQFLSI